MTTGFDTVNFISPTAPQPGTPMYRHLKDQSARLVKRLEAVGRDYDLALANHGMNSLQEGARYYQYKDLLDEYERVEDVLAGRRTPSAKDDATARGYEPKVQSARNLHRPQMRR